VFYVLSGDLATKGKVNYINGFRGLNNDGYWLFHLGNWRNNNATCVKHDYKRIAKKLGRSSIPVSVLPGTREWGSCDNTTGARGLWRKYLVGLETQWNTTWERDTDIVRRQDGRPENFSFIQKGMLHIGVNMVGNSTLSNSTDVERVGDNLNWVNETITNFADAVDAVIILGSAGNTGSENNLFFEELKSIVVKWNSYGQNLTVIYVKQSEHELSQYTEVDGLIIVNIRKQLLATRISYDARQKTIDITDPETKKDIDIDIQRN